MEPIFTNKNSTQKIILVEIDEVIAENIKTAEIFNDYFVNVAKDLNTLANIPRKLNERLEILYLDPIDIINDYKEHFKYSQNTPAFRYN